MIHFYDKGIKRFHKCKCNFCHVLSWRDRGIFTTEKLFKPIWILVKQVKYLKSIDCNKFCIILVNKYQELKAYILQYTIQSKIHTIYLTDWWWIDYYKKLVLSVFRFLSAVCIGLKSLQKVDLSYVDQW